MAWENCLHFATRGINANEEFKLSTELGSQTIKLDDYGTVQAVFSCFFLKLLPINEI
jgi:hypothetical protein